MAFKLTKTEIAELQGLIDAYTEACEALSQALADKISEWESDFDDKSERWQGSEPGQEARDRIDTLQSWADEIPDGFPGLIENL